MVEIITEEVKMPPYDRRRYQKIAKDANGKKWDVEDTDNGVIVYTGGFENASLICHNLNKKYYRKWDLKK